MSMGTRLYIQKREVIIEGMHVLDELLVNHAQQIMNHFEKNIGSSSGKKMHPRTLEVHKLEQFSNFFSNLLENYHSYEFLAIL